MTVALFLLLLFVSMGVRFCSELRPPTGLLAIALNQFIIILEKREVYVTDRNVSDSCLCRWETEAKCFTCKISFSVNEF